MKKQKIDPKVVAFSGLSPNVQRDVVRMYFSTRFVLTHHQTYLKMVREWKRWDGDHTENTLQKFIFNHVAPILQKHPALYFENGDSVCFGTIVRTRMGRWGVEYSQRTKYTKQG